MSIENPESEAKTGASPSRPCNDAKSEASGVPQWASSAWKKARLIAKRAAASVPAVSGSPQSRVGDDDVVRPLVSPEVVGAVWERTKGFAQRVAASLPAASGSAQSSTGAVAQPLVSPQALAAALRSASRAAHGGGGVAGLAGAAIVALLAGAAVHALKEQSTGAGGGIPPEHSNDQTAQPGGDTPASSAAAKDVARDQRLVGRWVYSTAYTSGSFTACSETWLILTSEGTFESYSGAAAAGDAGTSVVRDAGGNRVTGVWRTEDKMLYIMERGSSQWTLCGHYEVDPSNFLITLGRGKRLWQRR
jgi:hypothetical protein